MAFSVTNVGTNTTTAGGATLVVTYGGSLVSGVIVFVVAAEESATIGGSVANTHLDTFTSIQSAFMNNSGANGFGNTFYAANATLNLSDTVTYTKQTSSVDSSMSVVYITGGAVSSPLDTAVTAKATGQSGSPSVTGGVAAQSGDLNIGAIAINTQQAATGFAQAAGWTIPPNEAGTAAEFTAVDGGNKVNAGTTGQTYNPTITLKAWAAFICAFKPAAADVLFAQASL